MAGIANDGSTPQERQEARGRAHGIERRTPRKAVREAGIERSPRDQGVRSLTSLVIHDNGLWDINGEVCDTELEAAEAVLAVMRAMQRRTRGTS